MLESLPRVYPLLGLCGGYLLLVLLLIRCGLALRDGFRCITRYKRIWLSFALLGFAYSVFQFATFTPLRDSSELESWAQIRNHRGMEWAATDRNLARHTAARARGSRGPFR